MRGFDRDLIRGGHYGQRSCEPHPKAEHMAAPTNPANVKKALANSEPSTHGTKRTSQPSGPCSLPAVKRTWSKRAANDQRQSSRVLEPSRPAENVRLFSPG